MYPSMSLFYRSLLTMGHHKNLDAGVPFPSFSFLPSLFASFKCVPTVKPQQEGKSSGVAY